MWKISFLENLHVSTKFLVVSRWRRRGCRSTYIMYSIRTFARAYENDLGRRYRPPFQLRAMAALRAWYTRAACRWVIARLSRVYACTVTFRDESRVTFGGTYLGENIAFHWQLSTFRYAFTISPACTEKFAILNRGLQRFAERIPTHGCVMFLYPNKCCSHDYRSRLQN